MPRSYKSVYDILCSSDNTSYNHPPISMSSPSSLTPEQQGGSYKFPLPLPDKDPWKALLDPLVEKDSARCHAWKEEVQNLLIFAGLFSGVVTAFILDAYKTLQEDPTEALLSLILAQLNDATGPAQQAASISPPQFSPTPSNVRINTLWFLSLVFSFATVLIGIVSLQWLREHQRPRGDLEPQIAFSLHHMHTEALDRWYFPHIFTILPLLLQIGLVLFLLGLVDFLWSLNHTVATFISVAIGLTLSFLLITTMLPTLQIILLFLPRWRTSHKPRAPCPYKSAQSWAFHRLVAPVVCFCMQIPAIELDEYRTLDARNVTSVENRASWYKGVPRATTFIFRKKKGDTWLEYGIAWLFQRDFDYMEAEKDINVSRKLKERPIPLYDAVQGLLDAKKSLSPKAQKEPSPVDHCCQPLINSNVMEGSPYYDFLHRLARCSQLLTYGLPAGIKTPSPEVLRDNALLLFYSRGDSFDNLPPSMRQHGIEICIRLTEWMYAHPTPREYLSAGPLPSLPIKWVARQLELGLVDDLICVQEQILNILRCFFNTAKTLRPISAASLGETMHTHGYVRQFLFSAAAIIPREGDISHCNTLLESVTADLRDFINTDTPIQSDTADYLFYTAYMFSYSLLLLQKVKMTDSLRGLALAIQEYRTRINPSNKLGQHLGAAHLHVKWPEFCRTSQELDAIASSASDSDDQSHSLNVTLGSVEGYPPSRPGDSFIEFLGRND